MSTNPPPNLDSGILQSGVDNVGQVETHGTDYIPESERHGQASELLWVWCGAAFCLGIIVIGSLPIVFGLGWWASFASLTVGVVVGSILYTPLALYGPRTGTNDPVASGAHFGVRGRILAAVITIFVALGFYALAIWTGGQAIQVAGNKLFSAPINNTTLAISMAITSLVTVVIAVYGHATLILTYKWFTIVVGALLAVLVLVQLGNFDAGYAGGTYLLGSFWKTWFLSMSIGASLPISYATFGGDYSRYFSRRDVSDRSILVWNFLGMFLSSEIALVLGAYLTITFKDPAAPFVQGVADSVPSWFVFPFLLIGLLGTWPQGGMCLYGCGLSSSTITWKIGQRSATTIVLSVIGLAVVFLGVLYFNAIDSISAFVLIMNVTISPWMAIMLVGFVLRRGRYSPPDLQPYTGLGSRSIYWFTEGVNLRAFVAFVPAAIIGFMFSNTTLHVGRFANSAGGVDLSYASAFVIAGAIYLALTLVFPEREAVLTRSAVPVAATSPALTSDKGTA
jgi:purine-cytosine permease-like protein